MGEIEKSIQNEIGKRRLNILKGFSNFNEIDNPKKKMKKTWKHLKKTFQKMSQAIL